MLRRAIAPLLMTAAVALVHCSAGERARFEESRDPVEPPGPSSGFDTSKAMDSGASPDNGKCTEDIDVVLVLDVSSSMGFVLEKLQQEIAKVVDASNALQAGAHFGLVIFADNAAFSLGGTEGAGKIHTSATTLAPAFAQARSTYTNANRNPGDGPNGPDTQNPICEENSLDALHMAAAEFPWRPRAARVVILATDDTFLEKPDNYGDRDGDGKTDKSSYPREGDYPAKYTVAETISALRAQNIRVFSFSAMRSDFWRFGEGCGTGRRYPKNEEPFTWGWSKPFKGQPPIPDQTGGRNFDLAGVKKGQRSLAETINEVVLESRCNGPK